MTYSEFHETLPKHKATSIFLDGFLFFSQTEWPNKNIYIMFYNIVPFKYKLNVFKIQSYI